MGALQRRLGTTGVAINNESQGLLSCLPLCSTVCTDWALVCVCMCRCVIFTIQMSRLSESVEAAAVFPALKK